MTFNFSVEPNFINYKNRETKIDKLKVGAKIITKLILFGLSCNPFIFRVKYVLFPHFVK
jgi:hypothetical protein